MDAGQLGGLRSPEPTGKLTVRFPASGIKQITHAIRMAAYSTEIIPARAPTGTTPVRHVAVSSA